MKFRPLLYSMIMLFSLVRLSFAGEMDDRYQQGMRALQSGQYNLAIQEFEHILSSGWESPQLYYNLGNAYFKNGNTAGAVWAYEKCLRLNPRHQDAKYNLDLTNIRVKDRVDIPPPPVYLKLYREIKLWLSPDQWILLFTFLLLVLTGTRAVIKVRRLNGNGPLKSFQNTVFVGLILVVLVGANAVYDRLTIHEGIILSSVVTVTSEPNEYSTALFQVHDGLKVNIRDKADTWVEIELIDGKTGWIPEEDIRLLDE